jgi:hypothetical protein
MKRHRTFFFVIIRRYTLGWIGRVWMTGWTRFFPLFFLLCFFTIYISTHISILHTILAHRPFMTMYQGLSFKCFIYVHVGGVECFFFLLV